MNKLLASLVILLCGAGGTTCAWSQMATPEPVGRPASTPPRVPPARPPLPPTLADGPGGASIAEPRPQVTVPLKRHAKPTRTDPLVKRPRPAAAPDCPLNLPPAQRNACLQRAGAASAAR